MRARIEGEVLECTLSSGNFAGSDGQNIDYRNWKLRLFDRESADVTEVKLPGDLADENGVPSVGDRVAFVVQVGVFNGRMDVKVIKYSAFAKSNGAAPTPPPAAAKR